MQAAADGGAGVVVVEWLALEGWVMLPLEVWVVLAAWDLARAAHAGTQLSNELSHYWTDGPYLLSKPPEEEEAKMVQVCLHQRLRDVSGRSRLLPRKRTRGVLAVRAPCCCLARCEKSHEHARHLAE